MKLQTMVRCQTIVVLCYAVLITAQQDYGKFTKLWAVSGAVNSGRAAVVNVTSGSIVIPTNEYVSARTSRDMKERSSENEKYVFKPRIIPLRRSDKSPQVENAYYQDRNRYKSEILFPGNYFTIAKEKRDENVIKNPGYNSFNADTFRPKSIPLMRAQVSQKRSLDEETVTKRPDETPDQSVSGRSLSYILGYNEDSNEEDDMKDQPLESTEQDGIRKSLSYVLEDENEEIEDDEESDEETGDVKSKKGTKLKVKGKLKKYSKYMMPLLLAYKLKYFALVPVLVAGLILLVGATGTAGFFFALFAAVMALQKGSY